jgi:hypothetical protein
MLPSLRQKLASPYDTDYGFTYSQQIVTGLMQHGRQALRTVIDVLTLDQRIHTAL